MEIITLEKRANAARFIEGYVDIARFAACCAECRGYGRTWACPPYEFDPMEIWRSYESVLLYAKKVIVPEELLCRRFEKRELAAEYNGLLLPVKRELMRELYAMERERPGSLALSAGGCDICAECTRGEGLPCRFPDKLRYSVESLGGDVLKSIEDFFGETILWAEDGRLPEHYILLGALLEK